MVTALDPGQERVKGIEAGADDFLSKPINQPELLARVRSLLRIKELWDTVQSQAHNSPSGTKTSSSACRSRSRNSTASAGSRISFRPNSPNPSSAAAAKTC